MGEKNTRAKHTDIIFSEYKLPRAVHHFSAQYHLSAYGEQPLTVFSLPQQKIWWGSDQPEDIPKNIDFPMFNLPMTEEPKLQKKDMSVEEMYMRLRLDMQTEHIKTRDVVRSEVLDLRRHLVECVKESPNAAVSLGCKYVLILAVFSLLVQLVVGFTILNPFFAMLLAASAIGGLGMTRIQQKKGKTDVVC